MYLLPGRNWSFWNSSLEIKQKTSTLYAGTKPNPQNWNTSHAGWEEFGLLQHLDQTGFLFKEVAQPNTQYCWNDILILMTILTF